MKRKAVSIILALCLLLTLAPMAMADEKSANEISTFEQLQQAFENGGTYTLTDNITVESGLILTSSTPAPSMMALQKLTTLLSIVAL